MLVRFRQMEHDGPLWRDAQEMNPHTGREDPACSRVLHRLLLLVGERGPVLLAGLANALRQSGIHQQTHGHHHEPRHDPRRRFAIARGSSKAWVFAKAHAAFRISLPCVAGDEFLGG